MASIRDRTLAIRAASKTAVAGRRVVGIVRDDTRLGRERIEHLPARFPVTYLAIPVPPADAWTRPRNRHGACLSIDPADLVGWIATTGVRIAGKFLRLGHGFAYTSPEARAADQAAIEQAMRNIVAREQQIRAYRAQRRLADYVRLRGDQSHADVPKPGEAVSAATEFYQTITADTRGPTLRPPNSNEDSGRNDQRGRGAPKEEAQAQRAEESWRTEVQLEDGARLAPHVPEEATEQVYDDAARAQVIAMHVAGASYATIMAHFSGHRGAPTKLASYRMFVSRHRAGTLRRLPVHP